MSTSSVRVHNRISADVGDGRCLLAVQAKVRGYQDLRVTGENAQVTGRGHGVISVRVGQVLIYLEDREAMFSWIAAIQRASELQDRAYGPELPIARTKGERLPRRAA